MMFTKTLLALALMSSSAAGVGAQDSEPVPPELISEPECKPVGTVENFVLENFVANPWYVHEQAENAYSPPDRNNCVRAEYTIREEPTSLWGYTVDVRNAARDNNGKDVDAFLCAYQEEEETMASKLMVAPCFLPKELAGPYWVVAYDESQGYALISGGQPTIPNGAEGCRTGEGINNSGLWIFTRSPVRNDVLVNDVKAIAKNAGFDITVLNFVNQDGCYDETEATCTDSESSFPSSFGGAYDCDWVGNYAWYRCWLFSDKCPETCGKCD